jgi:mycothiol system anti-sigma-R factor
MKGSDGCSRNLLRHLDQELSGQKLVDFRAHLEECAACRQEIEVEEELSRLLHRSRPLYAAPDALRDRVLRAIGEPLPGLRPNKRSK